MKRGKLRITYECLMDALGIDSSIGLEHIAINHDTHVIDLYITGAETNDKLPECKEGTVSQYIPFEDVTK
jgi:hypothetical protein